MKYCTKCGAPLADDAAFCPQCEAAGHTAPQNGFNTQAYQQQPQYQQQPPYQQPPYQQQPQYQQQPPYPQGQYPQYPQGQYPQADPFTGMKKAAKILMIISTVLLGLYIIPLAWCIPMTVSYCNKVKAGQPVSTGFKVCCLLFVSVVGGILMLCDQD